MGLFEKPKKIQDAVAEAAQTGNDEKLLNMAAAGGRKSADNRSVWAEVKKDKVEKEAEAMRQRAEEANEDKITPDNEDLHD